MSSGTSGQVVHCPNCNEDVPKTLYCLNCGFPLYKDEQPKEEVKAEPEVMVEPKAIEPPVEEDAVIMVEEEGEVVKPEESKMEAAIEAEAKKKVSIVEDKPVEQVLPIVEPEVKELETTPESIPEVILAEEKTPEPAPIIEVEETKPVEVVTPSVETPPVQVETQSEPAPKEVVVEKIDAVELFKEQQTLRTYVPDPLTKNLIENIAKNISLKIKLVKLYRDGSVKEEMFTKLYERYVAEGKIWSSRREELLGKLSAEIELLEDGYKVASEALELLEVNRSIGEVSEGEYIAKAPAYRWDIDHFDNVAGERKDEIAYLENISNALTDEELNELRSSSGLLYNTLESLQISNDELLSVIKDNLYEAIKILG